MDLTAVPFRSPLSTWEQQAESLLAGHRAADPAAINLFHRKHPRFLDRKIKWLPKSIADSEIRDALSSSVVTIVDAIKVALENTPPELSADISDRGVVLTGGGALLKNLDTRISKETGLPVLIADAPLLSVVVGAGKMLDDFALLRRVSIN